MLAARLLGVSTALLLLPGLMLLAALRVETAWPHRIVLAFCLSYSWVLILSIIVPLGGWTVDHAGGLTVCLLVGLGVVVARRAGPAAFAAQWPYREALLVGGIAAAWAVCAWIIEPAFTGEEALDLASISRFADGGWITFTNTSLLPDTRPVYLVQPYQLALGLIARWSATDPVVAFVKFRTFLAPLTLLFLYGLLRRLTATRTEAAAAFAIVLVFIVLDTSTSQWNGWFPFVRRGGFSAGLCVPALMALCLAATRRAANPQERLARRVALATAPVMLTASLATHPLEMLPLLCFAAGLTAFVAAGLDPAGDRMPALVLIVSLVLATGVYLSVVSRAVPAVVAYGASEKQALWAQLRAMAATPLDALVGGPTDAQDLLTRTLPGTTVIVFGIPAMALAALRAPAAAALLALGIVPLALAYASPAGFVGLQLASASSVVRDVNAYFGLLGLLSLAIGLTALVQAALQAAASEPSGIRQVIARSTVGSIVIWIGFEGSAAVIPWFARRVVMQPALLLLVAVVVAVFTLIIAIRRTALVRPAPFPATVVGLAVCAAAPLAAPDQAFGGFFGERDPVTLTQELRAARSSPSVLDWPSYYEETLRRSIAPPIEVPVGVVNELRERVPPRQVVLTDPRYSCALVVLLDGYCINPEKIYNSLYFKAAERYHADYVHVGDGGVPEHPFFNQSFTLTAAESRLLTDYGVSYVLTDPGSVDQTTSKLETLGGATLEMDRDGYRLYRIKRS